ncbi:MAG: adenosylmethionine decarboxylase [Acidobacteriota bacterium]|nr:adenosylmethionine decarboxylase [Acidobacteriota bacterium]MDW3228955.1 adenosylmethionine decarboxylase [Acidobacteriota bacterium]
MTKDLHSTIGHHYIVEASGCDPKTIGSVEKVQQILVKAAEIAGAQVWSISFSRFPPNGVSGVVVISESHISTHTWPEKKYGALDIYTCGNNIDPEKAVIYAIEAFGATTSHITEITRGIDEGDAIFYHSFITWEEHLKKEEKKGKEEPKPESRR